ncbi:HPr family phosphocarrier protein [Rubripirellula sp.]|jgi:phosphotransferase system HPr (HPr) family protein|nr:HPr family phosphocarrier protein [Planctomycetaceae bacterium]MDA9859503.1 HPr family phosphocarrier protein [Rubripirellula sp.]MDF1845058.1 HPr family phosphocarrier protein [Rubripirellula sp.]
MNNAPLRRIVTVNNPEGLHARPADMLVRTANKFTAEIMIGKDSEFVDCKSILSLLTLGAAQGTELTLTAQGDDAGQALESIAQLFDAGFDETDLVRGVEPAVDS